MTNNYTLVEKSRATKWTRFFNYIIDLVIFYILVFMFGGLLGVWYSLTQSELAYSIMQAMENASRLVDKLVSMIMYATFMFAQEWIFKGRSIGKLITGTKVVNENNEPLNTIDLLRRNFTRAIPFEALSFLGNVGLHDKWSNTRVVNVKQFEESLRLRDEMEEIGQVVA
ncbi:RDD family protein [Elizabethkingia ursingii]|uniref:RDD family protein n=1 Tax=Elizabethkingia ursingii TaxID=1756150 RepID=UPI002012E4B5|nr:RDD family protein [Elizabethkingia ursingii]MCL1667940.1 RDD family protein [Elizabethkingia ursingii]